MNIPNLTPALLTMYLAIMPVQAQDTVRHVTQEEAVNAAISRPQPEYPAVARQLKLQGRVEIEVSITTTGSVEDVKVLTGNPALTGAAVNAVKRWRFEPFTSKGKAVRAVAIMNFTFSLSLHVAKGLK
jgi:TonB family protein